MSDPAQEGFRTSAPQVRKGAGSAENRIPHRTSNGVRGAVRNEEVRPARCGNQIAQDCRDAPGDVVLGVIEKKPREGFEIRLRDVRGGPKPVRSVLIRLCRKIPDGRWMPLSEGSRCGLTIAASQISAVIDILEKAEDRMADEAALP